MSFDDPEGVVVPAGPATGGLNTVAALANMPKNDAPMMENWIPYPDRVETRKGATSHATGFASIVYGLHVYSAPSGTESLWATNSSGIFNATAAGAIGAAAIALTNGKTFSAAITTGAGSYLFIGNGVDTIKQYDGAVWAAVAAFGGLVTSDINCAEVYKQRLYFGKKATLSIFYLGPNAVAGAATEYPLGALFRRGGAIAAIATWTIDSGTGPDDNLVVATSNGEIAVFSGTDPSAAATWALRGVYYIAKPVNSYNSLYKYGGDILFLSEAGLFPLSKYLLTASIDRQKNLSQKVGQLFADLAVLYAANSGWQILSVPDLPLLMVNVAGVAGGFQLAMHSETQAWTTFTGWPAFSMARIGSQVFIGEATRVSKVFVGAADWGANIVAQSLQAYNPLKTARNKQIKMARATYISTGTFEYTLGLDSDFENTPTANLIASGAGTAALWGSGTWGTSLWSSSAVVTRSWKTVVDAPGVYKAFYQKVVSNTVTVSHQSTDFLVIPQGVFG